MQRNFWKLAALLLLLATVVPRPAQAEVDWLRGMMGVMGLCSGSNACNAPSDGENSQPGPWGGPPGGNPFGFPGGGVPPPRIPAMPPNSGRPGSGRPIAQSGAIPCGRPIGSLLGRPGGSPGLYVGGQRITGEPAALQSVLRGSLTGVQSTPRTILRAMVCSPSRRFSFNTMQDLATNIRIRQQVLTAMQRVMSGQLPLTFIQSISDLFLPAPMWQYSNANRFAAIHINGAPLTWESGPRIPAHQAVEAILTIPSRLECLSGVEVVFMLGVEQAVGAAQFDAMHPPAGPNGTALYGIGVPLLYQGDPRVITPRISSARRHLIPVRYRVLDQSSPHVPPPDTDTDPMTGPIAEADMVPGDYVYINSISDYDVVHRGGAWNGENAMYMGPNSFYGLGLGSRYQTEADLRNEIADHYNTDDFVTRPWNWRPANPSEILWTLLASPSLSGDPAEAGPFVR